jgi:hypothetical protein
MKQIKLFLIIIFSTCLLFSCTSNHSSADKTNADSNTNAANPKATSTDANLTGTNGSFIYTINGAGINTANDGSGSASLYINEVSNDAANGMLKIKVTCGGSNVFHFDVSNSGATTISNYSPTLSGFTDKKSKGAEYMDGKTYRNLYAVSVTITITSINDSRVSGTFSGTFRAEQSDGGATANITDGSFNLPFIKR